MRTDPPGKAILYCRVSSKSQKERGSGLESQERAGRDFARSRNLVVEKTFYDAMTGGVTSRPGMEAMLAFLRKHRKDGYYVIIDDIDRWARDVLSHWQLRAQLAEAGGTLISPSIEFGETSGERLVENIRASVAQHHRDHNRDQTLSRMKSRALNGWWPFAVPLGFKYVKQPGNGKICVRDEPLASTVQEGLEGFASGRFATQAELSRFFESRPEFPRNRHGRVTIQDVTNILNRVFYAGFIHHERWDIHMVPARHEALIAYATYKQIQDRLNGKTTLKPRFAESDPFVLRGHVLCECGTPFTACFARSSTGKRYGYYHCPDKSRICPSYGKSIPMAKLEGAFEAYLSSLAPSPDLLGLAKEALLVHWERHIASAKRLVEAGRLELAKVERSIDQFLDRIVEAESETVVSAYERKIRALEVKRAELHDRTTRADDAKPDFARAVRTALAFLSNPCILWNSGVSEDRKILLKLAFPHRLTYSRIEGFRTQLTNSLFRAFSSLEELKKEMARPTRFERVASTFGGWRSIQLSYGCRTRGAIPARARKVNL